MIKIHGIQASCVPDNITQIMQELKDQISDLQVQLENALFMSVPQRAVCTLQKLCALHSLDPSGFTLPVSKTTIAMRLGVHNETFSRVLQKLPGLGVRIQGKQVQMFDLPRVQNSVCSGCAGQDRCRAYQLFHAKTSEKSAGQSVRVGSPHASGPRTPQQSSGGTYSRPL